MEIYKCGICGKQHTSVEKRNECEIACLTKQREEKKRAELENKQKIRNALANKIRESIQTTKDLVREYREVTGEEPNVTMWYSCDGAEAGDDDINPLEEIGIAGAFHCLEGLGDILRYYGI